MNCPKCDAWSRVVATRERDSGHRSERRRECANGHRFTTHEVHGAVWCSAKQRQGVFRRTLKSRAALAERNRTIRERLAKGETGVEVARSLGLSASAVWLVKQAGAPQCGGGG